MKATSCDEYYKALKMGEKSYRESLGKGEYPYLQVLEELLNHITLVREEKLGLQEIPIDQIHGTYAAGRRTAFAPNFMPLLAPNSEFAMKWSNLCQAHLQEGIKDAVTCYEYMNRYYIMEGNKRVSVLKFFGAGSVPGYVTRLVPRRGTSRENVVYYEYLEFYKICPVNFLVFSQPGSYKSFLELTAADPSAVWTEDQLLDLKAVFTRFKGAFLARKGANLKGVTVSDALLTYLSFYDYKDCLQKMPDEFAKDLTKIWDELLLLTDDDNLHMIFDAEEAPKRSLIGSILNAASDKHIQAAFIYHDTPETSDWVYGHELGRLHIEEVMGDRVTTKAYPGITMETIADTIEQAISDGSDIIFCTSRLFLNDCLKIAVHYPKIKFLDCTMNSPHKAVRAYAARIHEAKFLGGILAGCLSTDNKIGYVAHTPVPMNLINLNAFAMGVKTVNPYAKVHLQWTTEKGADSKGYFWDNGINLISGRDMIASASASRDFGLYRIENGVYTNLAMSVCDWGAMYEKLLDNILNGGWEDSGKASGDRALNYWWGMSSDVVDIIMSDHVPIETRSLIGYLENQIRNGNMAPYHGYIKAQDRVICDNPNTYLPVEDQLKIDWLLDNIIGHIPSFDELDEDGKLHVSAIPKKEDKVIS